MADLVIFLIGMTVGSFGAVLALCLVTAGAERDRWESIDR